MTTSDLSLTPELKVYDETWCLIRKDGEELFLVKGKKEAKLAVDSLAAARQNEATDEKTKVYREDLNDGKKVIISIQALGVLYDGKIEQDTILDFVCVPIAEVLKGRLEKNGEEETSDEEEVEESIELREECDSEEESEEETESSDSDSEECSCETESSSSEEEEGVCCHSEEWDE